MEGKPKKAMADRGNKEWISRYSCKVKLLGTYLGRRGIGQALVAVDWSVPGDARILIHFKRRR